MGVVNPTTDPTNVVQALVYTLLDVFDASRDLYVTLKNKEKRDYENTLRAKGYPESRRIEYVDDDGAAHDEGMVLDKAAVTRQFEVGYHEIGAQFAVGDVVSQTALQSQIITLQSVIITTFLYGPTSSDPISHQISGLLAASRAAGTTAVDVLAAQHQRQLACRPPNLRSTPSPLARPGIPGVPGAPGASVKPQALPYPVGSLPPTTSTSTSGPVARSRQEPLALPDAPTRSSPTIADLQNRPQVSRTDTESTSFSGPTSYGTETSPHTMYCLYAQDLQRHPSQTLSSSITSTPSPYCPYCRRELNLAPGRSWEVYKDEEGPERCFRIQNRYVVKCHRDSVDGGYSCVICSKGPNVDTVCGDVKALIRHMWMDHSVRELKSEPDIVEVVDEPYDTRRDSGAAFSDARSRTRRSASLGPSRRLERRPGFERDVDGLRLRSPR